ncbi:MAG: dihydroxy-acid dehydratase [Sphingomonadales bacterium]|nr:MAG: dihydroxy-acid dehydratase [Sphingomonadales bacterium]
MSHPANNGRVERRVAASVDFKPAHLKELPVTDRIPARPFRSREWFAAPGRPDMAALYLERFMNYGITPDELRCGKPIIGIAQSGSDIAPCNRIHLELVKRVRDGIRDAGGIPMEFPLHPIFENCRRPTAAIDRNLAYLGLVEILNGYPIDAVVLTTGCDKTTPSSIMAAATVDIPAITLNGGPMLDGWYDGELAGSGTVIWHSRIKLAKGEMNQDEFLEAASSSAPSAGHCNTMGTALTMNSIAEALGMSLPGNAAIPAPYRERGQMAYETGRRAVELAYEDLRPSRILKREAFLNAIALTAAVGGSTNAYPHIMAMARHAGIEITPADWMDAHGLPLIVNVQPAGKYLGERFHRAGGVPAVLVELLEGGVIDGTALTVTGKSLAENIAGRETRDREVIHTLAAPMLRDAGFLMLTGNLFDCAIMKTSVISDAFRSRYLSAPGNEGVFEARAIVFDGSDDYHHRINDPSLGIDEDCILVMRNAGPIAWPGSAEVVNMQPPDALVARGISSLPTLGDGRQSGTADSPSILNASPESAAGGGLSWLRTGDRVRIDLNQHRCDALVPEEEIARRKLEAPLAIPPSQTPWEELYREKVGQLSGGGIFEFAAKYRRTSETPPRHNH